MFILCLFYGVAGDLLVRVAGNPLVRVVSDLLVSRCSSDAAVAIFRPVISPRGLPGGSGSAFAKTGAGRRAMMGGGHHPDRVTGILPGVCRMSVGVPQGVPFGVPMGVRLASPWDVRWAPCLNRW